ncbi:MAG: FtsQ-type POTRA domain-containing protein [Deltaproteobacteria bacterium]|nr:FtsQ-type POTRA domain-containing protein [Deltaproteobacteria bacterium]
MAHAATQLSLGLASPRGRKKVRANRRPVRKLSWPARIRLILIGTAFLTTLVAVSLGLVAGYQALAAGDLFFLKRVTLSGQERLDREQVLALAGLKEGQRLLELKPALLRRRLLASPWVAQAQVRLIPPDEVKIHLVERRPTALVMAASPWFMDGQGVIFKAMEPGEWTDLPVITGLEGQDPRQAAGTEIMNRVREVLDFLSRPDAPLPLAQLSEIRIEPGQALALYPLTGGGRILLGSGRIEEAARRWQRVRADLTAKGLWSRVAYVDLRFKNRAFVGFKAG